MSIYINPGSGPVADATAENSLRNMQQFVKDLRDRGHNVDLSEYVKGQGDGRWEYRVLVDGSVHEVEMPGLALPQVRFLNEPDQNPRDFPRLYVDGSSWLWMFALNAAEPCEDDE